MAERWLIPHGVETNGVGKKTTAHLNLTGRTMADIWGLKPDSFCLVAPDGQFLHRSGTSLTRDPAYRWHGNSVEADKTRRALDVANGMRAERVA